MLKYISNLFCIYSMSRQAEVFVYSSIDQRSACLQFYVWCSFDKLSSEFPQGCWPVVSGVYDARKGSDRVWKMSKVSFPVHQYSNQSDQYNQVLYLADQSNQLLHLELNFSGLIFGCFFFKKRCVAKFMRYQYIFHGSPLIYLCTAIIYSV